jgi:hypothetical protein
MARTAVVAGTATAVSNRVSRRQARRWGAQEEEQAAQAYAQPAQAAPSYANSSTDELEQLAGLRQRGILTQEEFEAKKKQVLGI